jgi:hypothetical protein
MGDPRPGHPEGAVVHHVAEVLTNVDRYNGPGEERRRLRIVGSTHDTCSSIWSITPSPGSVRTITA